MKPTEIRRAVSSICRSDPELRPVVREHGHPELSRTRNAFASLGRAIIYQQLSGKAAGTIFSRFKALYPGRSFPRPEELAATSVETLRSVGVSRQKASYLLDLAARFASGEIQSRRLLRAGEDEVRATLTAVKGIGDWSVDMFLIFGLVRPDVLPTGDLGVRKGMQRYFSLDELPEAELMRELARPWEPYRSLASWYMWRVAEG
jgi:DNA-3-methyladenine glycosylase II